MSDLTDEVLDRLRADAQVVVDTMTCTDPAYGAPGIAHCAACCMGTLIAATCAEEEQLAHAASEMVAAIDALRDSEGRVSA